VSAIEPFYKTKSLRENGIFITVSLIVLGVLGYLIPDVVSRANDDQIYTVNGLHTKYNDAAELSDFIRSIKSNDGYLVMGTSESTSLADGNYYDFLNENPDPDAAKFSVLAGAGRTCGIHISWLMHHREELDSLHLIYFINPVYWRTDLSEVDLSYSQRYINYRMSAAFDIDTKEDEFIASPVAAYHDEMNGFDQVVETVDFQLREIRKNYFHNLYYLLNPEEYDAQFDISSFAEMRNPEKFTEGQIWQPELFDLEFNIRKSFAHKNWFRPIDEEEDFRYRELRSFITLCHNYGVHATFVLGPINRRFIEAYSPQSLEAYTKTTDQIRNLLEETGADYVDATDISSTLGAFDDHQHHSSYGAFLIYQKLSKHIDE
jgi:hypothetical protein